MNIVSGVVTRQTESGAVVRVSRASACGSCKQASGCAVTKLGALAGPGEMDVLVGCITPLAPGSQVALELDPNTLLRAAALAYGLPLLTALTGLGLAAALDAQAGGQGAGLCAGLVAGLFAARWLAARSRSGFAPQLSLSHHSTPDSDGEFR